MTVDAPTRARSSRQAGRPRRNRLGPKSNCCTISPALASDILPNAILGSLHRHRAARRRSSLGTPRAGGRANATVRGSATKNMPGEPLHAQSLTAPPSTRSPTSTSEGRRRTRAGTASTPAVADARILAFTLRANEPDRRQRQNCSPPTPANFAATARPARRGPTKLRIGHGCAAAPRAQCDQPDHRDPRATDGRARMTLQQGPSARPDDRGLARNRHSFHGSADCRRVAPIILGSSTSRNDRAAPWVRSAVGLRHVPL